MPRAERKFEQSGQIRGGAPNLKFSKDLLLTEGVTWTLKNYVANVLKGSNFLLNKFYFEKNLRVFSQFCQEMGPLYDDF